ncbi:MAG: hypothetical protein IJS22_05055 [Lachnospiraceae bacterium]|nr:hypothetical protein [Lachnospiraceae bacterium]
MKKVKTVIVFILKSLVAVAISFLEIVVPDITVSSPQAFTKELDSETNNYQLNADIWLGAFDETLLAM